MGGQHFFFCRRSKSLLWNPTVFLLKTKLFFFFFLTDQKVFLERSKDFCELPIDVLWETKRSSVENQTRCYGRTKEEVKGQQIFYGRPKDLRWKIKSFVIGNRMFSYEWLKFSMEDQTVFQGRPTGLLWKINRSSMEDQNVFYGRSKGLLRTTKWSSMEDRQVFYGNTKKTSVKGQMTQWSYKEIRKVLQNIFCRKTKGFFIDHGKVLYRRVWDLLCTFYKRRTSCILSKTNRSSLKKKLIDSLSKSNKSRLPYAQ